MSARSGSVKEIVIDARTVKELLHRGHIRQVNLQTEGGQILIGAPVTIDVARAVPRVLKAPAWAAIYATALVAKLARLRIVVERVE